jgi:hypothetical protein
MTTKRKYTRRSADERIAELQSKIDELQKKVEAKARPDLPVIKDIPRVQLRLRKFAQLAVNYGRDDLANSTLAFVAGLDRTLDDAGRSRNQAVEVPVAEEAF